MMYRSTKSASRSNLASVALFASVLASIALALLLAIAFAGYYWREVLNYAEP
jgi:hypothetical protein